MFMPLDVIDVALVRWFRGLTSGYWAVFGDNFCKSLVGCGFLRLTTKDIVDMGYPG
jgi:hypothetical protein